MNTDLSTTTTRPTETTRPEPTPVFTVRPAVDVYESDAAFTIVADVPGATTDSVELEVVRGTLQLGAVRTTSRGRVRYARGFTLPDAVDPEGIGAVLRHGVLTVTVPKKAAAQPRRIEVKAV